MIIGMGSDMTDIRRIEKSLARFGERFENRVFTPRERQKAATRKKAGAKMIAATYAKRFAAKEACAKALGTGMNSGVFWQDMEVINLPTGAPTMQLSGGALVRLKAITPNNTEAHIHLTLTDEYPYALAHIVITAESTGHAL